MPRSRRPLLTDEAIRRALEECGGRRSAAAHKLGISPRTLQRWLAKEPILGVTRVVLEDRQNFLITQALYELAISGNFESTKWWLEKFAGWTDKPRSRSRSFQPVEIRVIEEWESTQTLADSGEPSVENQAKQKTPRVTTGFRICDRTGRIRKTTSRDPKAEWIGLQLAALSGDDRKLPKR